MVLDGHRILPSPGFLILAAMEDDTMCEKCHNATRKSGLRKSLYHTYVFLNDTNSDRKFLSSPVPTSNSMNTLPNSKVKIFLKYLSKY